MNPVLFQIGLLQVEVIGFNFDEFEHETGADFAVKDIVGAQKPREFVGEADDNLSFRGKLFPLVTGGADQLDIIGDMSKSGDPQMVVRGDGLVYGWYLIHQLTRRHSTLTQVGFGRLIEVDVKLVKSPTAASAQSMLSTVFGLFG